MSSIVIAPFSNSEVRDWPAESYRALIEILLSRPEVGKHIRVIGTKNQSLRASDIVRYFHPEEVANDCGKMSWDEVLGELSVAACVIGNNSGIAHLAGAFGVPTVCVFGGSHQRLEWRPRGAHVALVTYAVSCSPCHIDHGKQCPYGKRCLAEIEPSVVAQAVLDIMKSLQTA
jgi:ADP-heptose:LPS heptosyltransferase